MSTIRETVSAHLSPSYVSYGASAIEALEEREHNIAEGLRAFANERGLSDYEVDTLFVEVGLMEPTPEPETVAEIDSADPIAALTAQVARLSERLEQAITAAGRHGVMV